MKYSRRIDVLNMLYTGKCTNVLRNMQGECVEKSSFV